MLVYMMLQLQLDIFPKKWVYVPPVNQFTVKSIKSSYKDELKKKQNKNH